MKKLAQRMVMIIGGIALLIGGVILLFLPGPGVVLIGAGIFLISPHHGRKLLAHLTDLKHRRLDPRLRKWGLKKK
jgi:hypothetical protein